MDEVGSLVLPFWQEGCWSGCSLLLWQGSSGIALFCHTDSEPDSGIERWEESTAPGSDATCDCGNSTIPPALRQ